MKNFFFNPIEESNLGRRGEREKPYPLGCLGDMASTYMMNIFKVEWVGGLNSTLSSLLLVVFSCCF